MKNQIEGTNLAENKLIIWAVDPSQDPREVKGIVKELRLWARQQNMLVQPVTIVSDSIFNFPIKFALAEGKDLTSIAREAVRTYLKKTKTTDFLPPEIIFISSISRTKTSQALADHARYKKAALIMANTRARKTKNPFRIGGFVEKLLTFTRIPVLVLNQNSQPNRKLNKILYPTDFSVKSNLSLRALQHTAKQLGSRVTLFSQVEIPNLYSSEINGSFQALDLQTVMAQAEKEYVRKAQSWVKRLLAADVKASFIIRKEKQDLAHEIINAAQKNKMDFIAMSSNSGPIAQTFLGSIARDVLLLAKCPVLIYHNPIPRSKHPKELNHRSEMPRAKSRIEEIGIESLNEGWAE